MLQSDDVKSVVREKYAEIARSGDGGCGCGAVSSCCGGPTAIDISRAIGYSNQDLSVVPDGANLGLGCGNPTALASLGKGEVVLDLGSGGGFDCFLAAQRVGESGRVIGVDMTPEMIERARNNAAKGGYENVEFRLGDIENLPVDDASVDVVISNCVVNLAPDKAKVFREVFRVLKPGGRMMISDIVLVKPLSEEAMRSVSLYIGCVAGAWLRNDYLGAIKDAGFSEVEVLSETQYPTDGLPQSFREAAEAAVSIGVKAIKS